MRKTSLFRELFIWGAVFVCCNFLILSCGSSRQQTNGGVDSINIDELLGEENGTQPGNGAEQAEVLRLLGITTEEDKHVEASQTDALQSELEQLKQDLMQKDQEITVLRSDITQKEVIISDLEAKTNMAQIPANIGLSGQLGGPSAQFKLKYKEALNQFKSKSYQPAIAAFSELLSIDSNTFLSDNCQYWIGESYYGMENYNQAIVEFAKVFSFPNTNKADDAQLKLGISHLKLGETDQALAEFQTLLSSYPNSEYVELAQRYLAKI